MLCDIFTTTFTSQPDFEVVGECAAREDCLKALRGTQPDVLLLGLGDDALPSGCSRLFGELPKLVVVAVTGDGRRAGLLDEASADGIVETIRTAVRPSATD